MTITIEIPDNVAASFAAPGRDLAREVLEAFALEGYRSDTLDDLKNDVEVALEGARHSHEAERESLTKRLA